MASHKHKISRSKAKKLADQFIAKKKKSKCFKQIPDGFLFDVEEVRQMIKHPSAKYFIVQMGLKVTTRKGVAAEELTPVLFLADDKFKAIEGSTTGTNGSSLRSASSPASDEDEGGGFLDESNPYPPPPIDI